MKNVAVIGHFGGGHLFLDGQTIKTKIVAEEIERCSGENNVTCYDTYGGIKILFKILLNSFNSLKNHKKVVAMPDSNGVRVIFPWLKFWNLLYKREIHYVVIGGWLSEFLKNKKILSMVLKKLDGIYVETTSMKNALEDMGFTNIFVMPNCKKLNILNEEELVYPKDEPYRLCTFSRVMEEKGIEDAVNAVKAANDNFGRIVYTLDIYGQVDSAQTEWFEKLKSSFPEYVTYGGLVPFDKSVEVLKNYFALLFPTRFYTEGIPGTFIDAYAAGVPVITALWMNSGDIFENVIQGLGYEFGKNDELNRILVDVANNNSIICDMKPKCLIKAKSYLPEEAMCVLTDKL